MLKVMVMVMVMVIEVVMVLKVMVMIMVMMMLHCRQGSVSWGRASLVAVCLERLQAPAPHVR